MVLHADTRSCRSISPSHAARRDYQCKRCGTADVFCAVEPKVGRYFTKLTTTRASPDVAKFPLDIASAYPAADTIHLVLDNLSTHTRKAATNWFGEADGGWLWIRFAAHHPPKHGGWLNLAEIEIGLFSRQCLGKRRFASLEELTTEATGWNKRTNHAKTTIKWKFTRHKVRLKLMYKMTRS